MLCLTYSSMVQIKIDVCVRVRAEEKIVEKMGL